MEFTGKITHISDEILIASRDGQSIPKVEFMVEQSSAEYPERIVLTVMGEDKVNMLRNTDTSESHIFSFSGRASEPTAEHPRMFNDLRCWRIK